MRLFLVILAFTQLQGYEQKPANGANFSTQFRASPEVLRQMANDQADSIKSDRINNFQDDQNPMRSQEAPYQSTPNKYQPLPSQQQFENALNRVVSPDTAQDYTQLQGDQDRPTQGVYQKSESYQNSGPSPARDPRSYKPQQTSLDRPTNYQSSEPGPVSVSAPAARPTGYMPAQSNYGAYSEIPQSTGQYQSGYQPQTMPQNYQAYNNNEGQNFMQTVQPNQPNYPPVNQDARQDYTQSTWAGSQPNPQSYQLGNKNSDTSGAITISLPGNEEAAQGVYNSQGQQQPQFVDGYQVINEGPVDYMVSSMSPGSTISAQSPQPIPPPLPTNYNSAANVIPQNGYMPVQNAYYPPQVAPALTSGQYFGQPENDVYAPYMGAYKPQDQQYDMWRPQQPPMPITMQMPYLNGNKDQQAKLMEIINSQLARQRIARMVSPF